MSDQSLLTSDSAQQSTSPVSFTSCSFSRRAADSWAASSAKSRVACSRRHRSVRCWQNYGKRAIPPSHANLKLELAAGRDTQLIARQSFQIEC